MNAQPVIPAVYGPVRSWRFGQSLGIDAIGAVSTCSYNCLYCQLGAIEQMTSQRTEFVDTETVRAELCHIDPTTIDVVTFSGSGEPTLAANLGALVTMAHEVLERPIVVLTNGMLLGDRAVQQDLSTVDIVAIKLDAVSSERWHRLNRPVQGLHLDKIIADMMAFRAQFTGYVAIQTMIMEPWSRAEEQRYKALIAALEPHEVQLNTPLRPRPLKHEVEARGNHDVQANHQWRQPRHVTPATLVSMGDRLQADLDIPIRHRYELSSPAPSAIPAKSL